MILVELNGGIGNQMFQFAAAKSLALFHQTELKLDATPPSKKLMPKELNNRPFELHNFCVEDIIATTDEIKAYLPGSKFEILKNKAKPNFKRKIYREPFFHYDPNFFKSSSDVYLKGLWQSEKYFQRFSHQIRKIYSFAKESAFKQNELYNLVSNTNSVSIHIRRGDYLAKISQEVLGLIPVDYYLQAIDVIHKRLQNPKFYFFSDDIDWVKSNIQVPGAIYVTGKDSTSHIEELFLMSHCYHNIIANSSFSWWGAWLNNNPSKIVIAPQKWFNNGPKDTQDLVPNDWIRI